MSEKKKTTQRTFRGEVVSDKMNKTIVVRVDRTVLHSKYLKRYNVSKQFKVHDEKEEFKIGDLIEFIECRPYSKDKKWRALRKLDGIS